MRFIGKHARSFGLGRTSLGLVCLSLACAGGAAACSSDDNGNPGTTDAGNDGTTTIPKDGATQDSPTVTDSAADAGSDAHDSAAPSDASDASDSTVTDAPSDGAAEAADAGDADADAGPALTFCQSQAGLNFCNDFDLDILNPLATDGGASSSWTQTVGTPSELSVGAPDSGAASPPNALDVDMPAGPPATNGDRSIKVVEQLTPTTGLSQAIYEFDINIAKVPAAGTPGGFATDFQFVDDSGGSDRFGFRIGVFSNGGALDHVDLEHNHPNIGGSDDIVSPVGGFTVGTWSHVKMAVAFAAGDAGADAGATVHFQLFVNRSATAAVDATYPAAASTAAFARFAAGMVFAFDDTNKDWNILYDNFTLKIQ
jgi:hypothetical protein